MDQFTILATLQRSWRTMRAGSPASPDYQRAHVDMTMALNKLADLPDVSGMDHDAAEKLLTDVAALRAKGADPIAVSVKLGVPLALVLASNKVEDELRAAAKS